MSLYFRYASTLTLTFGKRGAAYLLICAVIICALGAYVIYAVRKYTQKLYHVEVIISSRAGL